MKIVTLRFSPLIYKHIQIKLAGTYTILVIAKDYTLNETSKEVTIIVEPIKYIVTFDYGYDNQANIIFAEEDKPIEAFPNLTRENYQFVEWLLNGETFDETTPVSSDMTLVGSWGKRSNIHRKL